MIQTAKIVLTLKKYWKIITGSIVLVFFLVVWFLSRGRSGLAAKKILELQKDTEKKIFERKQKTNAKLELLDRKYEKEYQKIEDESAKELGKIIERTKKLSDAAIRREVLKDLDKPL